MREIALSSHTRSRRGVAALIVGVVLCLVALGLPFASKALADTPTPAPACPDRWTCVAMPNNGGQLQVGPANGVVPVGGSQPWVFLRGYGFRPGDIVRVHYCSLNSGLTPSPSCVSSGSNAFSVDPSATLRVMADGTIAESTQVPLNDPSTPFQAAVPGTSSSSTFNCDGTSSNVCGIVVTDGNLASPYTNTPTAGNSAAVPINYDLASASCPDKQSLVVSQSDFGIGPLLPTINRLNCQGSKAYNFFNTEQSGVSALSELYNAVQSKDPAAVRVAFTDDPEAPDQQKFLPAGHFVLIPVALTATVVGFSSQMFLAGTSYPMTTYNLSPNMVAGIFTGLYTGPAPETDSTACDGGCPHPPCVIKTKCSLLQLATPHPGYYAAQQFGAYSLAYQAGITDHLTSWICQAPLATVPWGSTATTEDATASEIMQRGLIQGGHPVTSCPVTDQWPAETVSSALWTASVGPQGQMKAMRSFLPPIGAGANSGAAFAYMTWPWASYLGLDSASLLNASNTFQAPSQDSIYAALKDAKLNPDGTLTPTYNNPSNTGAYPMPNVIYAAVSTDTMPDDRKAAITAALTSMLDVTGGAHTDQLPTGYVPLTPDLYKQATAEVATAIGNPNFKISSVLPQLASTTPGGGSSFSGGLSSGSFASAAGSHSTSGVAGKTGKGAAGPAKIPSSSPRYGSFLLTASSTRMLIPWVAGAGVLALVLGAFVLLSGGLGQGYRSLRRRLARAEAPDVPEDPTS
jgi:hypothetical protein